MDAVSDYITLGNEQLHYLRCGNGEKLLLAFHGYANTADMFLPLASHLPEDYTLISIDLPHHGKTKWSTHTLLDTNHLVSLVHQLQQKYNITKLSLIGYSMGGRVCLKVAEAMPDAVGNIILLASDGLTFNTFYYFVTRTTPGRYLFNSFIKNPDRYIPLVEWVRKRNWIDASRHKFAMQYLNAESDRYFLLKVWPCMSLLIPDNKKLRLIFRQYRIPITVFMGKHDRIIPVALAERFKKELNNGNITLHILDKGHKMIDADTVPVIAQSLSV